MNRLLTAALVVLLALPLQSQSYIRPPRAPEFGTSAAFQTPPIVSNPTTVEFVPSTDHSIQQNGVDLVARYELQVYTLTGSQPVTIQDIAKPTPVSGLIAYNIVAMLAAIAPGQYVARVAAIGPGGAALSGISNTFRSGDQSPCTVGGANGPVVIVITRLTRAVSRSDPEGAVMLFRASSVVSLKRIKIDVLEVPELPGWEMVYGVGTLTADVRGFAVRPGAVGTWPVVIEAEDINGCLGKTDGSHRITVVP